MVKGIAFCRGMSLGKLKEAGFEWLEIPWGENLEALMKEKAATGAWRGGLRIRGEELLAAPGTLQQALDAAGRLDFELLSVETGGLKETESLEALFLKEGRAVLASGIRICLENGYTERDGCLGFHGCSEAEGLIRAVSRMNGAAGERVFGAGLDAEAANLLGESPGELARALCEHLMCVGAGDNDGRRRRGQLPYTSTSGRGDRVTDWPGLIRGIWEAGYQGPVVIRVPGLFRGLPAPLAAGMTELLGELAAEWERQLSLAGRLKAAEGGICLFGCGIRFENYMTVWGEQYPPALAVDNNPARQGERRRGVLVERPERLLDFDPEHRLVLVCCERFEGIAGQLAQMGVAYEIYDDAYWGRFIV